MKKDLKKLKTSMKNLVNTSNKLPNDGIGAFLKVTAAYWIIDYSLAYAFPKKKNPIPEVIKVIDAFAKMIKEARQVIKCEGRSNVLAGEERRLESRGEIESFTQGVYGDLWKEFNQETYADETLRSLKDRLVKNNIDLSWFKDKTCLDAGCGGGRYTVALSRFGTKKVTGLDMTDKGLKEAEKRANLLKAKNVFFKRGNVLNMPFPNSSFDFVLSNGVLHHTVNTEKGISEIARVLKKNGKIFLYLEGKGGLFWDLFYLARKILKNIPEKKSVLILKTIGLPGNRIFYFIDAFYVALQNWVTPVEVERWLKRYGFTRITRLYRGADYDRNEYLFNPDKKHKYSTLVHGAGQIRYIAEKK